jgi:aerobic carbon-monoxide dehydrogenase medium subunit
MIPSAFEYLAPTTLQEAVSLLSTHRDEAKLLAGGHSLLPMMKLRLAAPASLIWHIFARAADAYTSGR